jgi:hypothetical protein
MLWLWDWHVWGVDGQAVERERELASVRLREQSERFDQQLQVRPL